MDERHGKVDAELIGAGQTLTSIGCRNFPRPKIQVRYHDFLHGARRFHVRGTFPGMVKGFARRSGMFRDPSMPAGSFYAWCTPNV